MLVIILFLFSVFFNVLVRYLHVFLSGTVGCWLCSLFVCTDWHSLRENSLYKSCTDYSRKNERESFTKITIAMKFWISIWRAALALVNPECCNTVPLCENGQWKFATILQLRTEYCILAKIDLHMYLYIYPGFPPGAPSHVHVCACWRHHFQTSCQNWWRMSRLPRRHT